MAIKIAVCDDVLTDCEYIRSLLLQWDSSAQVDCYPSAENYLFEYAEHKEHNILLLDIEMGEMDGVTLAKKIRKENEAVQIVFVTGYSDYIAEGYEVEALHYLMKPVGKEKLFAVLDRAAAKIKKNEQTLLLELPGETVRIPLYQIRYLEVRQNYVTVHAKQDYTVKKTLGALEKMLDERFYRMGRSYIVRLSCIERITKTDVYLNDGSILPLPRGQYEPLNRAIIGR